MNLKTTILAAGMLAAIAGGPANAALTGSPGDIMSPHVVTFDEFDGLIGVGPTEVGMAATGHSVIFTASTPSTLGAFIADLGTNGLWGAGKIFAATGTGAFPVPPDEPLPIAPGFGLLHYTFTGKVTKGAGAMMNSFDGGSIFMIAYGADTTILEAHVVSVSTPGGFNDGSFFGIVRPGADIRAIAFGGTGLVMDDLVFTTPVPEPETWAMMAAGLGLVGWAAARRRRFGA
jgi:hypothetical protein